MFHVRWVGNSLQKILVAPNSADILGRACSFAFQADRVLPALFQCWATLEQDLVFLAVAKIVLVN